MSFLNKLLGLEAGELPEVELVLQQAAASADAGISKKHSANSINLKPTEPPLKASTFIARTIS